VNTWDDVFLRQLHPILWLAWATYWFVSARNVKRTVRREKWSERLWYSVPIVLAVLLFSQPRLALSLGQHIWVPNEGTYGLGTALLVAGLLFSVWARRTLGRNWSGTVTVKEDHELIQTGPYRWVRHPIYTGILVALTGSAIAFDRWTGFVSVAIMFLSFWIKLLREEAWMRETFGEKYTAYCAKTKRLVPLLF
jgi:protein-S-isoprenylcysteine O-methyltransferase Ste14